jgi:myo-inositol-1(or 4)-monophosphatase
LPVADPSRRDDLDLLTAAAEEASALALGFFRRDPRSWLKNNVSPVSEADMAVDHYLRARLTGARPGYGWLSEETEDAADRLSLKRVFVVDPIDGTRGFLAGSDEWTVSLAIVEEGSPVVAALSQPVTGTLHTAIVGAGAHRDGVALRMPPEGPSSEVRAAGPRSMRTMLGREQGIAFRSGHVASLALRIAMVADGRLDLALAKANAHDWDVAAADLIVREAGGVLLAPGGRTLVYNRPDPRHPILAAGSPALARTAIDLVAAADAPT